MNLNLIEPGNIFQIDISDTEQINLVFKSHDEVMFLDEHGELHHVTNVTTFGEGDDISFLITTISGWIVM
jgi:hypothetical protein